MGSQVGRTSKENGSSSKVRDYFVFGSWRWTQEVQRNLAALRTFRVMMFILRHDHPEVFKLVTDVIRGIDTRHGLAHNRNTLDKPDNDVTSS